MDIVEKTGYQPNILARTLGSNKTYTITALLPNPQQDEYWGLATDGVEQSKEEWAQYGIRLKLVHFDLYDKNSFQKQSEEVLQAAPDGILMAPIFYQEALHFTKACEKVKIPFVLVNNDISQSHPLSFIGQDLYQSGRVGAELLEMNQHKGGIYAILHVYDDVHHSVHLYEKEQGFKDYFSEKDNGFIVKSLDLNYTHEPTIEKELNTLLSDKQLRGLLVTTSKGANVVSGLLDKHGKFGIRLVAYDLLKENLHYLNRGIIDFLIDQNSRRQASVAIAHLANHLVFKKSTPRNYLFPLEIISKQNLKSYLQHAKY
jgi:LacI family transcriptional regulator